MITALAVLSLLGTAHATEVANDKKVGIGAMIGIPAVAFTPKFYFSDTVGLALHAGIYWWGAHFRAQLEFEIAELADWDFARFAMYIDAGTGTDVNFWGPWVSDSAVVYVRPEVHSGVGVELQFHDQPASVFIETNLAIYPLSFSPA